MPFTFDHNELAEQRKQIVEKLAAFATLLESGAGLTEPLGVGLPIDHSDMEILEDTRQLWAICEPVRNDVLNKALSVCNTDSWPANGPTRTEAMNQAVMSIYHHFIVNGCEAFQDKYFAARDPPCSADQEAVLRKWQREVLVGSYYMRAAARKPYIRDADLLSLNEVVKTGKLAEVEQLVAEAILNGLQEGPAEIFEDRAEQVMATIIVELTRILRAIAEDRYYNAGCADAAKQAELEAIRKDAVWWASMIYLNADMTDLRVKNKNLHLSRQ